MAQPKDYIQDIQGAERRFVTQTVEYRNNDDANESRIEGYALKFNKVTHIGDWFREEILPGALDDVLNDDVRALFNHDPNFVLARSNNGNGTLKLEVDATGLRYSYSTPNTTYAKDLEENIRLGNVSQSSFGFTIAEENWVESRDNELPLRQIVKLKRLYDVSPVTYPAYQDTSVAKRSHDAFMQERANDIPVNEAQEINNQQQQSENEQKRFTSRNAQSLINNY